MRIAFKEWSVVVDALGRGEQILILRKGGISEGRGGFRMEHDRFFLFPTGFHQQRESVLPTAQQRFDSTAASGPDEGIVRISFCAEVAASECLDDLGAAERLRGQHIWRDEVIAQRFDWGRSKSIFAVALRVLRLPLVVELPMQSSYGGCKSWVELATDLDVTDAEPVLTDEIFQGKLDRFHAALGQAQS